MTLQGRGPINKRKVDQTNDTYATRMAHQTDQNNAAWPYRRVLSEATRMGILSRTQR